MHNYHVYIKSFSMLCFLGNPGTCWVIFISRLTCLKSTSGDCETYYYEIVNAYVVQKQIVFEAGRFFGPIVVLNTKSEWRVLIDNLPPGDVKYRLFVGWVSITTLGPVFSSFSGSIWRSHIYGPLQHFNAIENMFYILRCNLWVYLTCF